MLKLYQFRINPHQERILRNTYCCPTIKDDGILIMTHHEMLELQRELMERSEFMFDSEDFEVCLGMADVLQHESVS